MPDLPLVMTTVRRARGEMPQLPLVNMFAENAVSEPRQFSLISFPGLVEQGTEMGPGPVRSLFQKDGVLSGALIGVSGSGLYAASTVLGTVGGALMPSIAGNEMGVVATAGLEPVFWTGSAYSLVDFPDGAPVRKVFEQGGRFLFLREASQKFYWTDVLEDMLDGSGEIIVDGLSFASAESEPDHLVDAAALGDRLVLGGTNTIEFWTKTGDIDLPYVPVQGLTYEKGVRETGCMAAFDNTVGWVSPENIVYRAGNIPERISDAGIEELIAASTTCRVDPYFFEGHEFLKVALDEVTIEYDAQTRQWAERKTGTEDFKGGPVVLGPLFGSKDDGTIYAHGDYQDLGGNHERAFCINFPINGGAMPIDNIRLRTNPGHTDTLTGYYANPVVELFQSYDGGETFDVALPEYLGEQGHYRKEVEWRALGFADAPGLFIKFRVTDPVSFRVSGAFFNETHGGRSR